MNWNFEKLRDILILSDSGIWGDPADGNGNEFPVLRSTNIHEGNMVFDDIAIRRMPEKTAQKYILKNGDIIVTTSSGSLNLIGKNAIFKQPQDQKRYLFSNFTLRLRTNKILIIPKFLYFYLNSSVAKSELEKIQSTTSGLRNLNRSLYLSQIIHLPPLSEQRRIVEILDQADALRKMRAEANAKAERILPALFYLMFGDSRNLNKTKISTITKQIQRRNPSDKPNQYFLYVDISGVDGKIGRIVKAKRMLGSEAPSRARQVIKSNDILISTVRPYLKATAFVPKYLNDQICSTGFCVLRPKNSFGYGYLYTISRQYWFTNTINNKARGASYPAVTDKDIFNLEIPYPDDDELVRKFDFFVDSYFNLQDESKLSDNKLNALFSNLLKVAYSGNLTADWREAHAKELLAEMEQQQKYLNEKMKSI